MTKVSLSRPAAAEGAHGQAERQARVPGRVGLAAGDDHRPGLLQERLEVDPEQSTGDEPT